MHKLLVAVATIFQVAYLHAQSRTVPMQSTTGFPTGLLLCAVFVALMGTESVSQAPNSSAGSFALVGGTIHVSPSEEPIRDGTVLIQGEDHSGRRQQGRCRAARRDTDSRLFRTDDRRRVLEQSRALLREEMGRRYDDSRRRAESGSFRTRSLDTDSAAYSIRVPCGRTRARFVTVSSPGRCRGRESARRERPWFRQVLFHRKPSST